MLFVHSCHSLWLHTEMKKKKKKKKGSMGTADLSVQPTSKWNANELGFFDPNYNDKTVHTAPAMEHTGKDTYFRDIHLFID